MTDGLYHFMYCVLCIKFLLQKCCLRTEERLVFFGLAVGQWFFFFLVCVYICIYYCICPDIKHNLSYKCLVKNWLHVMSVHINFVPEKYLTEICINMCGHLFKK